MLFRASFSSFFNTFWAAFEPKWRRRTGELPEAAFAIGAKLVAHFGAVQAAVSNIQDLIALGSTPNQSNPPPQAAGDVAATLECPFSLVGKLIGRQGETVKGLQSQTGAYISIDQNVPDGMPRPVTVRGPQGAVDMAHRLITEIVQGAHSGGPGMMMPGGSSRELEVNPRMTGRL